MRPLPQASHLANLARTGITGLALISGRPVRHGVVEFHDDICRRDGVRALHSFQQCFVIIYLGFAGEGIALNIGKH